jgi:rubrerythrin
MELKETIEKLSSLMKLDIDAIEGYENALKKISQKEVYDQILKFRDDHIRHVDNIADIIVSLGGTPPSRTPDLRGVFLGGTTILQGLTGTEGAIKALQTGEKLTNKSYADAVGQGFPLEIKTILQTNYEDEKNHLNYINSAIETRIWDIKKAA